MPLATHCVARQVFRRVFYFDAELRWIAVTAQWPVCVVWFVS